MTKRELALDLDSTLAGTAHVAFDLLCGPDHDYDYSDILSWQWGLDHFGAEAYLSALWHAWTLRPGQVPLLEDDIGEKVSRLYDHFDTVDIVTAHPDHLGITGGKRRWLKAYDIEYDDLVVVDSDETKADLGYTDYLDDKPALPAKVNEHDPDANVWVFDQKYNRDAPGDYTRVGSVGHFNEVLRQ